jgi:hypothetical protein
MMKTDQRFFTLGQAACAFPLTDDGRRVSVRSLWRWMSKGKFGIQLRFSIRNGRRVISAEAIESFLRETIEAAWSIKDPDSLVSSARAHLARQRPVDEGTAINAADTSEVQSRTRLNIHNVGS